jgi:hypothetical protein
MATIQLELQPFKVPTGAIVKQKPGRRQDGFQPAQELPLSELPIETLEALCEEFTLAVFKAAGHEVP